MIELYEYQKKYLSNLPPRAIMAADTGVGKTFMSLAHYAKHAYGQPLLILAPASKVRTGDWEREIEEYFGGEPPMIVEIFSYEKFSRNPSLKEFGAGKRAIWHQFAPLHSGQQWAVICDEVHRAKNSQSGIGKAVWHVTHQAPFFVGLSATPLPNGWIDFANYAKIFGITKNLTAFKKRYVNEVNFRGFPEIRNYWHEDELARYWQSISKRLEKKDANDLPEKTSIGVFFDRPRLYVKTLLDRIDAKGELLDSAPKLTHALRQTLTEPKMDYLSDLIGDTDQNVVVFYNYTSERDAILAMLKTKHKNKTVYRQDGDKHEIPPKESWANVKQSVTVAHYRSGGTGVEMQYASITVYFSPTYSYADYIQSIGRTHRNGQTEKTTFYHFRTRSTIEDDVYDALKNKTDFQAKQWKGYTE